VKLKNNSHFNMSFLAALASGFCKKSNKNNSSFNKTLTIYFYFEALKINF
jgi:hypothetical protein